MTKLLFVCFLHFISTFIIIFFMLVDTLFTQFALNHLAKILKYSHSIYIIENNLDT